jgi:hypothetical protein
MVNTKNHINGILPLKFFDKAKPAIVTTNILKAVPDMVLNTDMTIERMKLLLANVLS